MHTCCMHACRCQCCACEFVCIIVWMCPFPLVCMSSSFDNVCSCSCLLFTQQVMYASVCLCVCVCVCTHSSDICRVQCVPPVEVIWLCYACLLFHLFWFVMQWNLCHSEYFVLHWADYTTSCILCVLPNYVTNDKLWIPWIFNLTHYIWSGVHERKTGSWWAPDFL